MFGIDNTGVINQRQSPAIWQSDIADFPPNYILGRILIDTFQGGIYIDTANDRMQISSGANNYVNGVSNYGGSPGSNNVGLGGEMSQATTELILSGNEIKIVGDGNNFTFTQEGNLLSEGVATGIVLPATETTGTTITPNVILNFINTTSGVYYAIPAEVIYP